MKSNFLLEMQTRGYLNQCTDLDKLGEICKKTSISGYIGFDCTASSLHVGSLLQIMILKLMQKHGHRPIILLGGGTTLIGDPSGKDTTRKILDEGLTSPLITLASGVKMGKTEKGAIWLNQDLLSPYEYWQFWRNTDDRDVKRFLNFFTEINTEDLVTICEKEKNINNLKILLANEATKILHGEVASKKAEQTAKDTFEKGGLGADLPEIKINFDKIEKGISFLDLIVDNKILNSKSEVRRAVANKGFKIDDVIVEDEKKILQVKDFKKNTLKLSYGKKNHYLIKII